MRLLSSIAAAAALLASMPAAAYSTRYEVRHYPAAFTRTVNQALGTNVENYADGVVTIGFGTTPAPSLSVAATEAGTVGFDIDASYEFAVAATPVTAAAQAVFASFGANPPHIKIGEAKGVITLTAPHATGTSLDAYVGQPNGTTFDVRCTDGVGCGATHFHTALFLDAIGYNPYTCGAACPAVAPGTPLGLAYDIVTHTQVYGGPGLSASLLVDPVITLDPGFLGDYGLTIHDIALTPEAGFGNSGGAVPEAAVWLMLCTGFGFVGAALRGRSPVPA